MLEHLVFELVETARVGEAPGEHGAMLVAVQVDLHLVAFLEGQAYQVALILSWLGVGGLYLYRFILTYSAIHNQVRFNIFHFFLYLVAFEIAPLLLIYKLLLLIFQ